MTTPLRSRFLLALLLLLFIGAFFLDQVEAATTRHPEATSSQSRP